MANDKAEPNRATLNAVLAILKLFNDLMSTTHLYAFNARVSAVFNFQTTASRTFVKRRLDFLFAAIFGITEVSDEDSQWISQ